MKKKKKPAESRDYMVPVGVSIPRSVLDRIDKLLEAGAKRSDLMREIIGSGLKQAERRSKR